jgi:hypothetical protein
MAMRTVDDFETILKDHQESLCHNWDAIPPDRLYHYTTLSGMRGILETGVFWASDIRHMNDSTESTYAADFVKQVLAGRRDRLSEGLLENFRQHGGIPGGGTEWFPFAVCFCGTRDFLSQWRGYTREGEGVAVAVPFAALRPYAGHELALVRVCYEPRQQRDAINSLMDCATVMWNEAPPHTKPEADCLLGITGYILIQLLLGLKNPDFFEEDIKAAQLSESLSEFLHSRRFNPPLQIFGFGLPTEIPEQFCIIVNGCDGVLMIGTERFFPDGESTVT